MAGEQVLLMMMLVDWKRRLSLLAQLLSRCSVPRLLGASRQIHLAIAIAWRLAWAASLMSWIQFWSHPHPNGALVMTYCRQWAYKYYAFSRPGEALAEGAEDY